MSRPDVLTISEAVRHTGLSRRTLQRRVDAWCRGDRSPYAVMGRRAVGQRGERLVSALDAERVRRQRAGELHGAVTAEQWEVVHRDADAAAAAVHAPPEAPGAPGGAPGQPAPGAPVHQAGAAAEGLEAGVRIGPV